MAIEDDVLVIGGGISGMTAALAAAREGARVRLISHKESTLRSASGLVDVLGYTEDGEGPIADPFDTLPDLPDSHPYRIVGADAIRAGLALFDDVTGDAYAGGHTDRNALVPTFGGSIKPTARYPRSVAAGLATRDADALLVGFESLVDFDAPLAAAHLAAAGVPFDTRGVTISFPGDLRTDAKVTRFAHALDHDERLDGRRTRDALVAAVGPHLDGESRVGFPAVLGDTHADEVRADLADRLGVDVFEVPMGPPSLPGLRLEDLFETALRDAGVHLTTGNPVVGYETDEADGLDDSARIDHVLVERNHRQDPHYANEYVLATGGLVGKGIESDREAVREPVFDCHVPHPDDRYDWATPEAFGDQPFARFGVQVDENLRPLNSGGNPEFENLHAAGAVIGGYDFAAEKSGSGVSLATGYAAGTTAATQR